MNDMEYIQSKVTNEEKLKYTLSYYRFKGQKIVFTNGCFDLLHRGHVEYLLKASGLGDVLIIGLNSDNSVQKLKGPGRPLQDEYTRALILASFSFVDHVILFDEDTPLHLIEFLQPDVLVKGGDYMPEEIVGSNVVTAIGGTVQIIDYIPDFSTTKLIDKLKSAE
ncbi:MAG: D-glycero-beta-D-manno-heptose 1-phosphate adenylyltransferase [Bacteroidales bacterium]|nr:MAG: D-glycero-beta-D-manno-heptose 1-phosphate adenylyltransferase [Bacteroidales bacterium]